MYSRQYGEIPLGDDADQSAMWPLALFTLALLRWSAARYRRALRARQRDTPNLVNTLGEWGSGRLCSSARFRSVHWRACCPGGSACGHSFGAGDAHEVEGGGFSGASGGGVDDQ